MTTIVLADDHQVVRQGLKALLETEPDFSIIGEAGDGPASIEKVVQLQPDVLILDYSLPGLLGPEVTRRVNDAVPATQVIILSMYSHDAYVSEALQNGAAGYVLKGASATDLKLAIREVAAGRCYLSPSISDQAVETWVHQARTKSSDPYRSLTSREREALVLLAQGYTAAEVADRMFIGIRTVEMHRANLMQKLGLRSQLDLIRFAVRRGVIVLDA